MSVLSTLDTGFKSFDLARLSSSVNSTKSLHFSCFRFFFALLGLSNPFCSLCFFFIGLKTDIEPVLMDTLGTVGHVADVVTVVVVRLDSGIRSAFRTPQVGFLQVGFRSRRNNHLLNHNSLWLRITLHQLREFLLLDGKLE